MAFRDGRSKRDGTLKRDGQPGNQKEVQKTPPVWGIPEHGEIAADVGNLLICNSCQTPVLEVVKTLHKREIRNDEISPTHFKFIQNGKNVPPFLGIQCPKCFLTSPENKQFSSLCIVTKDSLQKFETKFSSVTIPQIISYLFTGIFRQQLARRKELELAQEELIRRIEGSPEDVKSNTRKIEDKSHRQLVNMFFIQLSSKSKTVTEFTIQKHEEQDKILECWQEYKKRFAMATAKKVVDGDITQKQLLTIMRQQTGDSSLVERVQNAIAEHMEKKELEEAKL